MSDGSGNVGVGGYVKINGGSTYSPFADDGELISMMTGSSSSITGGSIYFASGSSSKGNGGNNNIKGGTGDVQGVHVSIMSGSSVSSKSGNILFKNESGGTIGPSGNFIMQTCNTSLEDSGSVVVFSVSLSFIPVHSRFLQGFVCETEYFLIANSAIFSKSSVSKIK